MDAKYATFNDLIELPAVVSNGSNSQHERQTFICPYCQHKFSLTRKSVKFEKIEPETAYNWRETSVKPPYIARHCKPLHPSIHQPHRHHSISGLDRNRRIPHQRRHYYSAVWNPGRLTNHTQSQPITKISVISGSPLPHIPQRRTHQKP